MMCKLVIDIFICELSFTKLGGLSQAEDVAISSLLPHWMDKKGPSMKVT